MADPRPTNFGRANAERRKYLADLLALPVPELEEAIKTVVNPNFQTTSVEPTATPGFL
jgi:hypothetical protein